MKEPRLPRAWWPLGLLVFVAVVLLGLLGIVVYGLVTHPARTAAGLAVLTALFVGGWYIDRREKQLDQAEAEAERARWCPDCNGAGDIMRQVVYRQYEDGGEVGVRSLRTCELCGGSGRADTSPQARGVFGDPVQVDPDAEGRPRVIITDDGLLDVAQVVSSRTGDDVLSGAALVERFVQYRVRTDDGEWIITGELPTGQETGTPYRWWLTPWDRRSELPGAPWEPGAQTDKESPDER